MRNNTNQGVTTLESRIFPVNSKPCRLTMIASPPSMESLTQEPDNSNKASRARCHDRLEITSKARVNLTNNGNTATYAAQAANR